MGILVSIIMPNYNSQNTILSSLISIQNQTFSNFECIIVDDNSNDNSLALIEEFISKDKRFKLFKSSVNKGVSSSRNIGISISQGRFLTFLDSDDVWDKSFIENNLKMRHSRNLPISHSPYIRFKKVNSNLALGFLINPPNLINQKNIMRKNFIPLLTAFIDTNIVGKFFFKDIRPEDYDLWLSLIKEKNFFSISTKKVACYYRISDSQRSKNKIKSFVRIFNFYKFKFGLNNITSLFYCFRWMFFNIISRVVFLKNLKNLNTPEDLLNIILKN